MVAPDSDSTANSSASSTSSRSLSSPTYRSTESSSRENWRNTLVVSPPSSDVSASTPSPTAAAYDIKLPATPNSDILMDESDGRFATPPRRRLFEKNYAMSLRSPSSEDDEEKEDEELKFTGNFSVKQTFVIFPDDLAERQLNRELVKVDKAEPRRLNHRFSNAEGEYEDTDVEVATTDKIIRIICMTLFNLDGRSTCFSTHSMDHMRSVRFGPRFGGRPLKLDCILSYERNGDHLDRREVLALSFNYGTDMVFKELERMYRMPAPDALESPSEDVCRLDGYLLILERRMFLNRAHWMENDWEETETVDTFRFSSEVRVRKRARRVSSDLASQKSL